MVNVATNVPINKIGENKMAVKEELTAKEKVYASTACEVRIAQLKRANNVESDEGIKKLRNATISEYNAIVQKLQP